MIDKPPSRGHETPWHQDEAFWEEHLGYHACGVWLALDDVDRDNGCMEFLPELAHDGHRHPPAPRRRPDGERAGDRRRRRGAASCPSRSAPAAPRSTPSARCTTPAPTAATAPPRLRHRGPDPARTSSTNPSEALEDLLDPDVCADHVRMATLAPHRRWAVAEQGFDLGGRRHARLGAGLGDGQGGGGVGVARGVAEGGAGGEAGAEGAAEGVAGADGVDRRRRRARRAARASPSSTIHAPCSPTVTTTAPPMLVAQRGGRARAGRPPIPLSAAASTSFGTSTSTSPANRAMPSAGAGAGLSTTVVPAALGDLGGGLDDVERELQLQEQHRGPLDRGGRRVDVVHRDAVVGAGDDHDRVLAVVLHEGCADARCPRPGRSATPVASMPSAARRSRKRAPKSSAPSRPIIAVAAPARAAAMAWLQPLPPRKTSKPLPTRVSPGLRAPGRAHDEVHHEAAEHHHPGAAHAGPFEPGAEGAAGVVLVEVGGSEALGHHQGDGEGVAHHRGDGGRRGGRQVVRDRPRARRRCRPPRRPARRAPTRHRSRSSRRPGRPRLHHPREALDLRRAPRLRDGEQHVARRDHAGVAVQRVGGVHEERRRAGARQRGRQLGARRGRTCRAPSPPRGPCVASSSSRAGSTWSKRSAARVTSAAACSMAWRPAAIASVIGRRRHRRSGTMRSPVTWLT